MASVCIIYPADPLGVLPSGIDTFIDGLIRWAPSDVDMRLIGVTTDPVARRVGQWNRCSLGGRSFDFFPLFEFVRGPRRPRVPVIVRFLFALLKARPAIEADILEFHRLEPVLLFLRDRRPKTCFIHQNMAELRNKQADIRWKHAPRLYHALERFLIKRLSKLFCVREDAVVEYRARYPEYPHRFAFTPTWVDPLQFSPASPAIRLKLRNELARSAGFRAEDSLVVFVGRLDQQKDPLLLLRAFELVPRHRSARLIIIGDGALRSDVESFIEQHGLADSVALIGLRPKSEIANWLRAVDLFVLSSAYEGMPMAALEALGSGLPVVSTDVGEVRRVVKPGVNGEIVAARAQDLADGIQRGLDRYSAYAGAPCTSAVADYSPAKIVGQVYRDYRELLP